MKLYPYEMQKLANRKFIAIVLLFASFSGVLFFLQFTCYGNGVKREKQKLVKEYSNLTAEEAIPKLEMLENELTTLIFWNSSKQSNEMDFNVKKVIEKYKDVPYLEEPKVLNDMSNAIEEMKNEYKAILSYGEFLNSIKEESQKIIDAPIFGDPESFTYRNVIKTKKDFDGLEKLKLHKTDGNAVIEVSRFYITDILMVAIICLICIMLFSKEEENGMRKLIHATKKGGIPLTLAQVATMLSYTIIVAFILYGINITIGAKLYGYGDLNNAVQSIDAFRDTVLPITVGEYLSIFFIAKIIISCVCAMICAFVCFIFGRGKKACFLFIGLVTLAFLMWRFIPSTSVFKLFKYLNLFGMFDSYQIIAVYQNLNIFGYPIELFNMIVIIGVVVTIICIIGCMVCSNMSYSFIEIKILQRFHFQNKKCEKVSILSHELYKNMFCGRVWIVLVLALLVSVMTVDTDPMKFDYQESIYKGLVDYLAGPLTQDKENFIKEKRTDFEKIEVEYDKMFKNYEAGKISEEDFRWKTMELSTEARKKEGFERIDKQYNYILSLKKQEINGSFLCEFSTKYLFFDTDGDYKRTAIFLVLMIIAVSGIFPREEKAGLKLLLQSTKNGHSKLFYVKMKLAAGIGAVLIFLIWLPKYITLFVKYSIKDWMAPIQSVEMLGSIKLKISVLQFVLGMNICLLLGGAIIGCMIAVISQFIKKQAVTIILSGLLFLFPIMLFGIAISENNGMDSLRAMANSIGTLFLPIRSLFNFSQVVSEGKGIYFLLWPVLGCIAFVLGKRKYAISTKL